MTGDQPSNPEIRAVLAARPAKLRSQLLALRRLILDVAASIPEVGPLEETLKWGQPSFLTSASKSGTTIRIDQLSRTDERPALFVPCQTDLITMFKAVYPTTLTYQGNRAIILDTETPLPEDTLRHCIALALTYKWEKAGRSRSRIKGQPRRSE